MALQLCKYLSKLPGSKSVSLTSLINRSVHLSSRILSQNNSDEISASTVDEKQKDKRGYSKDNPVLVASTTDKVIVGCNCTSDDPTLKWFYLEEGPAQVCDCGFYFKLDMVAKGQWIPEYSQVMQVDKYRPDPRVTRKGLPFSKVQEPPSISPFEKPKIKT